MSIAILNDVYTEVRRISIAGSVVAPGDFRLKKLVEPLRKSGDKAPIFTRIADCVEQVINSTEKTAGPALLELGSIVNSVLYTQGATEVEGKLVELPPSPMKMQNTQTSARALKPLLEALTTSGGGRLEQIKSSLDALDDSYSEVREFVAEKILPLYGQAIFEDLKSRFDVKGKSGHCVRLKAMHRIAPAETREIVKKALEEGSKEMKIVAIECLGDSEEDLSFLLEQARAKSKDVRGAAYISLARLKSKEAQDVLVAALDTKDSDLLYRVADESSPEALVKGALKRAKEGLASLLSLKNAKEQKPAVERVLEMMHIAANKVDKEVEAFLIDLINQSETLRKIKTDPGGGDLIDCAIMFLAQGGASALKYLVDRREQIPPDCWHYILPACRKSFKPAEFFKVFSVYIDPKAKKRSAEAERSEAVLSEVSDHSAIRYFWYSSSPFEDDDDDRPVPLDPKWMTLGIEYDLPMLVYSMASVKNKELHKYLSSKLSTKPKKDDDDDLVVAIAMLRSEHPDAEKVVLERLESFQSKTTYWYAIHGWSRLASQLSAKAIPTLESIVANPKTSKQMCDGLIDAIQEIRSRK
jgi:hypothetical protein